MSTRARERERAWVQWLGALYQHTRCSARQPRSSIRRFLQSTNPGTLYPSAPRCRYVCFAEIFMRKSVFAFQDENYSGEWLSGWLLAAPSTSPSCSAYQGPMPF